MEHRSVQFGTFGLSGLPETFNASSLYSTISDSVEWERALSLTSSGQSSTSQKPLRRIACIHRSTEMNDNNSPVDALESPMNRLNVRGDDSGISDSHSTSRTASANSGLRLPVSLHGLSLAAGSEEAQTDAASQHKSEILARNPENSSPVLSTASSVTFKSLTLEATGSEIPTQMTKSKKKRMKRKKKKRQDTLCVKIPCAPYSSNSVNEVESHLRDLNSWQTGTPTSQTKIPWQLADLLMDKLPDTFVRFHQQGIQNLGSTCFLASAMQFLLGSSRFCWLMAQMGVAHRFLDGAKYPVVCALGSLSNALRIRSDHYPNEGNSKERCTIHSGIQLKAVAPNMMSPVMTEFQSRFRQERGVGGQDVQEFLLFILESVDRELVHIKRGFKDQSCQNALLPDPEDSEDSWMMVGKKNKVSVQRTTGAGETSILSAIFGGYIQSEVKASGMVSSVTTHSFTMLILDIVPDCVLTIEDALDLYVARDSIPDYISKSGRKVMATKTNVLKKLPPCLIIYMKQYKYTRSGMEKVHKCVGFGSTLEFKKNWIADGRRQSTYRLCATCNHHGQGRGGDHYTANVLQRDGYWVHFNDSTFQQTSLSDVLSQTPYLLMYEML